MKKISTPIYTFIALAVALIFAAIPEQGYGKEERDRYDSLAFGKQNSPVAVYIITDWFCSTCSDLEPLFESLIPDLQKKTAVYFIDRAIHPETMNFVPYNLYFLQNEKQKYLSIRRALHKLAEKTKTPTDALVQAAVRPLGVTYQPLNYGQVDDGIKFFEGIARTFKIDETPTILIVNRNRKLDARKFAGRDQISREKVLDVVNDFTKTLDIDKDSAQE